MITIEIKVPNGMVGLGKGLKIEPILGASFVLPPTVIGRGGEMINKLQSESGARIQVAPGKLLGCCSFQLCLLLSEGCGCLLV